MATSSSKRGKFWRADWFVGVLVVLAVLVLHSATDFFGTLERRYYDFASTSTSRQPSDRIAIIAIDDQSIANIGRWPWSRDVHAQLIDQLAAAKAKTIAHTVFFFEPQTDRGLVFIRKIKEALGPPVDPAVVAGGLNEQLSKVIAEAEVALDTDAKLAASMAKAGNVLVPSIFVLGEPQGKPDSPLPAYALKSPVEEGNNFSLPAIRGQQPIEIIGSSAAGIGHLNQLPDVDGAVRQEPLLINYYGKAVPSMALLAAVKSLNLEATDIRLNSGEAVKIGKLRIGTDEAALMLPQFYKGRDGKPTFAVDSFYDVLSGKIPASKYTGKIVIIGATAVGVGTQFPTPAGPGLSPAETIAHITSSILSEHFIVQPGWAQLMYKIANEPAPDIRLVRQDLSERLADIVALSLSKTSETRYQDGDRFAADLRAVIAEGSAAPAPASGPEGSEKTVVLTTGENPAFEKTIAARSPRDTPAVPADTDLKP